MENRLSDIKNRLTFRGVTTKMIASATGIALPPISNFLAERNDRAGRKNVRKIRAYLASIGIIQTRPRVICPYCKHKHAVDSENGIVITAARPYDNPKRDPGRPHNFF